MSSAQATPPGVTRPPLGEGPVAPPDSGYLGIAPVSPGAAADQFSVEWALPMGQEDVW
jgi:hypothetical protein